MTIFRTGFFLLILINLIFFAWTQGYWGSFDAGHEPQRLGQQLNVEKLHISTTTLSAPTPGNAEGPLEGQLVSRAEAIAGTEREKICQRVDGLSATEAEALRQILDTMGWQAKVTLKAESPVHLVFIPELANRAAAEKKAAELERRDITGFTIAGFNNQRHEIHLGRFKDEPSAREHLLSLTKKGITSARLERRLPVPTRGLVETTGPKVEMSSKLPALIAAYAGATSAACVEAAP